MSLIVSEVYDALIEAGTSADKARAAAAAIPVVERLATKEDIAGTREDLAGTIARTREDLAGTIAETRENLAGTITEVRQDIARLEARLDKKIAVLNLAVFSFGPAILGLLVKLVFFP